MKIVVIGGSGGIGAAVVSLLCERYPEAEVYAAYFNSKPHLVHANLHWRCLDATDDAAVAEFAKEFDAVNIVINAIGFLHDDLRRPEKALRQFDVEFFDKNLRINTLTSILLAKYFEPSLRKGGDTHFVSLSAKVGSIGDNRIGGWLSYRVSKAALNMAMTTIAIEWRRRLPRCCVLLFHPGTTDTGLSKPFQANLPEGQLHSAELTASALIDLIQRSDAENSGQFVSYNGSHIPW